MLGLSTAPVYATLYQTIFVNATLPHWVEVNGARCKMEELPAAIAKNVRGDDKILIRLLVSGAISKAEEKRIIGLCRQAGARTFEIGFKD